MDTKTCIKGHTMTGIGFDECPEGESPWKSREGGEEEKHSCYYGCSCECHSDQDGMFSSCPGSCCTHYHNCVVCMKNPKHSCLDCPPKPEREPSDTHDCSELCEDKSHKPEKKKCLCACHRNKEYCGDCSEIHQNLYSQTLKDKPQPPQDWGKLKDALEFHEHYYVGNCKRCVHCEKNVRTLLEKTREEERENIE